MGKNKYHTTWHNDNIDRMKKMKTSKPTKKQDIFTPKPLSTTFKIKNKEE